MAGGLYLRFEIPDKELTKLKRALKTLGERDAPFLAEAMERAGQIVNEEVARRAPGSMAGKVTFGGVKGVGGNVRALGYVTHPGAKSMEFGRRFYYRGFAGNNRQSSPRGSMKSGTRFESPRGQKARPFIGIVNGDAAMAAAKPKVVPLILAGISATWDDLGGIS